ncbi:MAG: 50S ribosome-binding GTPase [Bifidobacteriaceae bacterium]|jgi:predicted GTPase|nr:50S ribosome-binding GTPase [Bifidobacteriaceae bacterium]
MIDQQVDELRSGIDKLRQAADLLARRLDEASALEALAAAELLSERLDRGVDHTVVALSGGTGSGKSSVFNAIAEMAFAPVGVVRPTTSKATACVWGSGAEELLEWLGIGRDSWIKRDSVLESHIGELRGLILVDLPDYDSASEANHEIAERVLALADVLVSVTDPQKYADQSLNERFVATAKAHPGRVAMVVLNQIDTVAPADAEAIARSLTGMLVERGLTDPIVALTSAKTGAGVDALRAALMERMAQQTMAMTRAGADLSAAAKRLGAAGQLGGTDGPVVIDVRAESEWLGRAEAAAQAIWLEAAIGRESVRAPEAPGLDAIRQAASVWAAEAATALPDQWAMAVVYALASAENIASRLRQALAEVQTPPPGGFWARLLRGARVERRRRAELEDAVRRALAVVIDRALARPTQQVLDDRRSFADLIVEVVVAGEGAAVARDAPLRPAPAGAG